MEILPSRKANRRVTTKAKTRNRGGNAQPEAERMPDRNNGRPIVWRQMPGRKNLVKRYLTVNPFAISSTAGGVISFVNSSSQSFITALGTEFTNFAQEYSSFRIKHIEIKFLPRTTSATSVTGPFQGGLAICPWFQFPYANATSLQQSPDYEVVSTLETSRTFVVLPRGPNHQLWNEFGVSIPADREFGLCYAGTHTLAASSEIFGVIVRLLIEFQTIQ